MKRALGFLDGLVGLIVALLFAAALLLSLAGVAGRYVSTALAPDWGSEVVIYLVIWAVLLSAARVLRRATHIRVDFLVDRLPAAGQRAAEFLSLLIAFALGAFLVWSGWQVVDQAMIWDERSISSLRMPLWIYYAALPASFALQLIFLLERVADLLRGAAPVAPAPDLSD
ncbi:TRAP transporter small permease [Pararhodobacter aggregans]|uniref:TRAP transporter small permease protein n=1 Tax=Pararhodobacter aggregans TaxID=404875 RepID=A0A2T7UU78_9RHOB|nr:TRAP transporter small permease [Pararhodobacter aggregans]PTX02999.1 TRAP-type C4-dicarboxylate transport system permease small subunit [Pararhodobacter aggregans]PVE48204.1 hypothetical protein DDE23_08745 [Pararhodobacter aggregans]